MKILSGGVCEPAGFTANGLCCGIKRSGKPDLSLIYSEVPCVADGVFTRNSIKAAPLVVSQQHLARHRAQAVIVNSGNANCFTGSFGLIYARRTTEVIARTLGIKPEDVIVSSTGIIGKPLPFDKIAQACPELAQGLSRSGGAEAAKGILTTDTFIKEAAVEISLGRKKVRIGACAKGSGMIQPDMATMLAFVTTDAAISAKMLKQALKEAVDVSFNNITVDGCMSTNDMVTLMANGLAANKEIRDAGADYKKFTAALTHVCVDLAKKIVLDGEGATKFVEIVVNGAKSEMQARKIAMAVANSNLVKTAAFGSNPNWGRVAAAVGSLGLKVTEKTLKIKFSPFDRKEIRIQVGLTLGKASATVFTSDLSSEYVRINAEYN